VKDLREPPTAAPVGDATGDAVNPFPGPKAYRGDQEHYFFGRAEEIEELTALVLSTSATLLYAPSGTGKSSLLHAGLAPHLEHHFGFVLLPTVHVGRGSRSEPAHGGANQFVRLLCETISDDAGPAGEDIAAAAGGRRSDPSQRVLLILDQFEEVFDDAALWRDREEFFAALTRALAQNTWLRVVIALRSDYLADLVPYERHLPNNLVVRYQLESLTDEQAQHAITSAFAASGVGLSDVVLHDLLDALLQEAQGPGGSESMRAQHVNTVQLQIACRRLWDELKEAEWSGRRPELSRSVSSLRSSMTSFVDEAIGEVVDRDRAAEAAVRWWLDEYLITPTGRRAFVLVGEDETAGLPNGLVKALEEVRLVQIEQRHGSRLVELTHDSMVEGVRASNDAYEQRRDRRELRRRVVLAGLLAGLLALFPFLQVGTVKSDVIRGTLTGQASHRFPGQEESVVLELDPVQQALTLRVVADPPGSGRPLVERVVPAGGTRPTAVPVRTDPGHTYEVVLTSAVGAPVPYQLTLTAAPVLAPGDTERDSIASARVVLDPHPGQRELVRVEAGDLAAVIGSDVIAHDTYSDWAVVDVSGPVALRLESKVSTDPPTAATVRRRVLNQSDQLTMGRSR
jgi:hypothetical protein